jgi:glycosyltransferase involved in cell wall biosynthesis
MTSSSTSSSGGRARRCLIVMPAYNEEESLPGLIAELNVISPEYPILVVDDGSYDRTSVVAKKSGATVLELPFNLGVGGAMRAGFKYASEQGFDAVIQLDADGQHPPAHLPELLDGLHDSDVVVGARFAGRGAYTTRGPRRWAMTFFAKVVSSLLDVHLTDVTSGFRASGSRAIDFFADEYPQEYLGDTIESLVLAGRAGLTITQVPVEMRPRELGQPSQSPFRAAVYLFRASVALVFILLRRPPRSGSIEARTP